MPLQPQMFILVLFHDKGDCVCLSHDAVPSPAGKGELKYSASVVIRCRPESPAVRLDN